jgi:hypothetical protein
MAKLEQGSIHVLKKIKKEHKFKTNKKMPGNNNRKPT